LDGDIVEAGAANEVLNLCRVVEREDVVHEPRRLGADVTRERLSQDSE